MKRIFYPLLASYFLLIYFAVLGNLNAQSTDVFNTPGTFTWTVPACVTSITVDVWGGGGGGGAVWSRFDPAGNSPTSDEICTSAGGGGGGGYTRRTYTVIPGQTYTIVVGAGGIGGVVNSSLSSNRAQNGSAGGTSTFSGPATAALGTLSAFGGLGGFAANILRSCLGGCSGAVHQGNNGAGGNGSGGANGTTTFLGGNGGGGNHSGSTEDRSGSGGGGAGSAGNGGNGTNAGNPPAGGTGGTGNAAGSGGDGIRQPFGSGYLGTNGTTGNAIGGGGGGACGHNRASNNNSHRSNIGGNGARGEVRISYSASGAPTLSFANTNLSCSGSSNGAINVTVSGGAAPYTYNWGSGITSEDRTGLAAGIYTVTISDAGNCSITNSVTITEPPALTATAASTNISCSGLNNGSITISAGGGSGTLTYNWGSGITSQNRTGLSAGTYTVTVSDANNCTITRSATITAPSALSVSTVSVTNGTCLTAAAINISVSGGTLAYNFIWSNGASSEDLTNLSSGSYTVTVSDANGCSAVNGPIAVNSVAVPVLNVVSVTAVSCNSGNNGAINISVTGGVAPYSFNWGSGITSEDRTGLSAGVYTLTVSDANACTAVTPVTVTQPNALVSSTTTIIDASCTSPGSININVSGGTGAYNYLWSNGAITEDLSGLSAGNYTVTISDANGCSTVNGPNTVNAIAVPSVVVVSSANVLCNGQSNGSINISANGGTPAYTYLWSNGASTEDLSAIAAGNYSVTVSDNLGCTTTVSNIVVSQPAAINASISSVNLNCNGANNGSVSLSLSGGTAPYNFIWSNGLTTEDISALTAGLYTVSISDANGCSISQGPVTITQPNAISITLNSTNAADCGNNGGAIAITANGGTGSLSYIWSNGSSSEDLSAIPAGIYSVTVSDANSCSTVLSNITVSGNNAVSVTLIALNENCNETGTGSVNATLSGGTAPFSFVWSNGATNQNLTAAAAGSYSLTVSDANGCSASATATVIAPFQPDVYATVLPTFARDTTVTLGFTLSLSGGPSDQSALGVTYLWTATGSGNLNFADSSAFNTSILPGIDGIYTLLLTAVSTDGCIDTSIINLNVETSNPAIPTAFSPNADGTNDVFEVVRLNKSLITVFKVYNRWGELVYDNVEQAAWDGTFKEEEQPREVYIYTISWKIGTVETVKRGSVTLLR